MFFKPMPGLIEKATAATAAHTPGKAQITLHPHPTITPSTWQDFQTIFPNNHPEITQQIIANSIK